MDRVFDRVESWLKKNRVVGLVTVGLMGVATALLSPATALEGSRQGGILALQLAGTSAAAAPVLQEYGDTEIRSALMADVGFIVLWSTLLALLVLWTSRNYRTVSARRLGHPLTLAALGAGVLDLFENIALWLAVTTDPFYWALTAAFAWSKWLLVAVLVPFVIGGLLSLLLPGDIRAVLRSADEPTRPRPQHTEAESGLGLAFSGGGIRAASISLGALQALERDPQLGWDAAANVTAVSGGSYMAGAWSLARNAPDIAGPLDPRPWSEQRPRPGPEERHLRRNLGYLLSNTPRGSDEQAMDRTRDPVAEAKAQRRPAVLATVFTCLVINALVLGGTFWALSQPLGWFYRWYFSLSCASWGEAGRLGPEQARCLTQSDRVVPSILLWLGVGVVMLVAWVLLAKVAEIGRPGVPPAWLLVPKYLGYAGLALALAMSVFLGLLPFLVRVLWQPVEGNQIVANLVALAGALGSLSAIGRTLRKPLAKLAPTIAGLAFGAVLLFLICRWALSATAAGFEWSALAWLGVVVALLALVHFGGMIEFWSLAAFYRGKLRAAFATYRVGNRARAYGNGRTVGPEDRAEPELAAFTQRPAGGLPGSPLTICAAATVSGRDVRTHYGIPALSVTFSPAGVSLHAPTEVDGKWLRYSCTSAEMSTLMPKLGPHLTTMMAVGLSGAAVSPAMGRFKVGPVSMLLALANVRLGMWVPNPRYAAELAARGRSLPRPGLGYLLKEFLGLHDHSDLFLYVTDGGHWENTALVELLRTSHHSEMVCIDADSGPGNLAGSISKAVDLAELECAASVALRLDVLRSDKDPSPGRDYSQRSVNLGLVRRVDGDKPRISVLWYAKPALTQDMPPALLAYREVDPTFPRVNTVNQFFHVAQFAAYRDLGRFNAAKILAARRTLRAELLIRYDFAAFKEHLPEPPGEGVPDPQETWVLAELAALIDQLAADQAPEERLTFAEFVYQTVTADLGVPRPAQQPAQSGAQTGADTQAQ